MESDILFMPRARARPRLSPLPVLFLFTIRERAKVEPSNSGISRNPAGSRRCWPTLRRLERKRENRARVQVTRRSFRVHFYALKFLIANFSRRRAERQSPRWDCIGRWDRDVISRLRAYVFPRIYRSMCVKYLEKCEKNDEWFLHADIYIYIHIFYRVLQKGCADYVQFTHNTIFLKFFSRSKQKDSHKPKTLSWKVNPLPVSLSWKPTKPSFLIYVHAKRDAKSDGLATPSWQVFF